MGISWPAEYVDKLKTLWDGGYSASQIAGQFAGKYTRSAILGKVDRLGLLSRSGENRKPRQRRPSSPKIIIPKIALDGTEAKNISHPDNEPEAIGPIGDYPKQPACRWPHGIGLAFQYCGHPLSAPSPYCSHHRARAWVKPHNLTIRGRK